MRRHQFHSACLLLALGLAQTDCHSEPSPSAPPAEPPAAEAPEPREGKVSVPAGPFLFGATEGHIRAFLGRSMVNFPGMVEAIRQSFVSPPRTETLGEFYIDQFEVTNAQFQRFLESTGYQPSNGQDFLRHWDGKHLPEWAESFPVVWVSQEDAKAYCRWAGGRLPSELEWEKAARGGEGLGFPWGNVFPSPETANFGRQQAEPAGNRPGDVSPYQVYDLGGNVAELTASLVMLDGSERVVTRGGSFKDAARETLTTYRELGASPTTRREHVGFRCVAD